MHLRSKPILAALVATALLAIAVGGANARSLSVNERNFELIWNEALGTPKTKFEFIASANSVNVQCRLTLLGRFTERTIKKETTSDQGTINHGELESCTGGTLTIRTETLPWGLRYRSFTGTLPRIRSFTIGLLGPWFRTRESGGLECEFAAEANHPGVIIIGNSAEAAETGLETTGEPENITSEKANRIPLRGEFLCAFAGEMEFGGIGLIRNLPRTAKVNVTLVEGEPPRLEPSPISFGTLEAEELARRTVTLTAGAEALTVNTISVRSGNYFAITDPNRCVGARLEARRTCTFRVLFSAPGERGREFSDTVLVETTVRRLEDSVTART